jgi:hypothetical protein
LCSSINVWAFFSFSLGVLLEPDLDWNTALMCMKIQGYKSKWARKYMPPVLRYGLFMSRASWWLAGAMCGWALLIEDARRSTELTMYVLPRALESVWIMLQGKGILPFIPGGDSLVSSKI